VALTSLTSGGRSVGTVRSRTKATELFCDTIRESIKISAKVGIGYFELNEHKPWFDEGCYQLLDQRKQAKLQWLQDPSKINGDNLNNVRREASRHFRNKHKEYMKDKIN
jgi:hypothetical protein